MNKKSKSTNLNLTFIISIIYILYKIFTFYDRNDFTNFIMNNINSVFINLTCYINIYFTHLKW